MPHMDKLKQLSKCLLTAKKQAQETYLKSILSKEGNVGLSFKNMLEGGKVIGKIFLPLRTAMGGSSQIQQERSIC